MEKSLRKFLERGVDSVWASRLVAEHGQGRFVYGTLLCKYVERDVWGGGAWFVHAAVQVRKNREVWREVGG